MIFFPFMTVAHIGEGSHWQQLPELKFLFSTKPHCELFNHVLSSDQSSAPSQSAVNQEAPLGQGASAKHRAAQPRVGTDAWLTSALRRDDTGPHGSSSGLWIVWLPLCTQRVSTGRRWAGRRPSLKRPGKGFMREHHHTRSFPSHGPPAPWHLWTQMVVRIRTHCLLVR